MFLELTFNFANLKFYLKLLQFNIYYTRRQAFLLTILNSNVFFLKFAIFNRFPIFRGFLEHLKKKKHFHDNIFQFEPQGHVICFTKKIMWD